MPKIKIIADSAGDIPDSVIKELGIEMLNVPITVDGKGYFERKSFSIEEFYGIFNNAKETPTTSRIPETDFFACYKNAMEQGYTDLISITINASASGTNASAQMARERLYSDIPGAEEKLRIHVVDSGTYSMGFGWPTIQAVKMARDGAEVSDILNYLDEYFSSVEVYLGLYTLEYAKRSGRVSAATAFVGEALGLRPIISMIAGNSQTIDKIRGTKSIPQRLAKAYRDNRANKSAHVFVACGENTADAKELAALLEKETGAPVPIYMTGATITINAGSRFLAVAFNGKSRK